MAIALAGILCFVTGFLMVALGLGALRSRSTLLLRINLAAGFGLAVFSIIYFLARWSGFLHLWAIDSAVCAILLIALMSLRKYRASTAPDLEAQDQAYAEMPADRIRSRLAGSALLGHSASSRSPLRQRMGFVRHLESARTLSLSRRDLLARRFQPAHPLVSPGLPSSSSRGDRPFLDRHGARSRCRFRSHRTHLHIQYGGIIILRARYSPGPHSCSARSDVPALHSVLHRPGYVAVRGRTAVILHSRDIGALASS